MAYVKAAKSMTVVYSGNTALYAITGQDDVTRLVPVREEDFRPIVVYKNGVCSRCALDQLECKCLETP